MEYTETANGLQERYHLDGKKLVIETRQDEQPIVEYNKKYQNEFDGYTPSRNMKHVGQVPLIFIHQWLMESGLRLGSVEFTNYMTRKLNDPDFRMFRTGLGEIGKR